ncbi:hypothetical protein PsalMR5_04418 (plasmid) [Piscirickettsia salmonis]|nr:hypothetical protein [Piscirickettsia salmonis]QGP66493.1 hypothetical protein PsalMR5_04418 [Piscirickettsia salmonis]
MSIYKVLTILCQKLLTERYTLNARRRASLDYRAPNHVFLENLMAA